MFIAIEKHVFFPCFIQLKLCCSTRIIPNRVNPFNPAKEKNATRAEGGNHSQSVLMQNDNIFFETVVAFHMASGFT